jgi:nuclear-control-of-ATPase protein 2
MATYAVEEIQRLNSSLLELQRQHLCNESTISTLSSTSSLTTKQAYESGDKTQFLLTAIQALDASLSAVPRMEDISVYLTWYTSLKKDSDNGETMDTTLDWLFVTKCTLAAYGHTLSSILQSTLPLSESLAYWDGIYGNSWYEAYYGIQSKLYCIKNECFD